MPHWLNRAKRFSVLSISDSSFLVCLTPSSYHIFLTSSTLVFDWQTASIRPASGRHIRWEGRKIHICVWGQAYKFPRNIQSRIRPLSVFCPTESSPEAREFAAWFVIPVFKDCFQKRVILGAVIQFGGNTFHLNGKNFSFGKQFF